MAEAEINDINYLNQLHSMEMIYFGIAISSALFGINCLQTYIYYNTQKGDKLVIRLLIPGMLLIDALHQAFVLNAGYVIFILSINKDTEWFSNPPNPQSISVAVLFNSLAAFVAQIFFASRIHALGGKKPLLIILGIIIFSNFATNIVWSATELSTIPSIVEEALLASSFFYPLGALCIGVIADAALSLSVIYYLRKGKSGIKRSDTVVNKVILYTVASGLITAVNAIVVLILYLLQAFNIENAFFLVPYEYLNLSSTLYSNALLATLNMRGSLRGELQGTGLTGIILSSFHSGRPATLIQ